jgi:phosphoglucosamine mutase
MRRLFGTDGIRGVAGEAPLDAETLRKIGRSLAGLWSRSGRQARIILGRDTRISGKWITEVLSEALDDGGIDSANDVGVISTPGLAYLTRRHEFDLGIMVSASHNPFPDNGIKIFGRDGFKLSDDQETKIERLICQASGRIPERSFRRVFDSGKLVEDYVAFLKGQLGTNLTSFRIGLDVCNGSAHVIGPKVFRELGASVEVINDRPDGKNINLDCGSLYLSGLISLVTGRQLDMGVAFDGDADRSLFVTPTGKVFDGDFALYALALHLHSRRQLKGNKVVGTIMSNFALERALEGFGIKFLRAAVGDRYVLEMMKESGANLGGEPSGHIILSDYHTAGDGILTAIKLAEVLRCRGVNLDALAGLQPYPQVLDGVKVREKIPLDLPPLADLIRRAEEEFKGSGRLVIRYSGTEPVLRIMAEGPNDGQVKALVKQLKSELEEVFQSVSQAQT